MSDTDLRYGFGKNWSEFIEKNLSDTIVEASMNHMRTFMRVDDLKGKTFIDIGCGSGIHSLAALRLGAERVFGFDYDQDSVATSRKVREWSGLTQNWEVTQGSVLDKAFMESLPKFDIVYSWGVLHHTGDMWNAVANAGIPLRPGGEFYIALYSTENYYDPTPEEWVKIKKQYNYAGYLEKKRMEVALLYEHFIEPEIKAGRGWLSGLKRTGYRGMRAWTDVKDWLGGYPMEFSGLVETRDFVKNRLGLDLVNALTGEGCSEFLFADLQANSRWAAIDQARTRQPLYGPFNAAGGYAFSASLPQLADRADNNDNGRRSTMMLYENDRPFGYAHAVHKTINEHGKGRFSHWTDTVVFSSSDNTDPNVNGRAYSYVLDY